jgi:alpha-aminoadipic semialdehyde synthase
MIDTLWALGARLEAENTVSPFASIRPAHAYADLDDAKRAVKEAGDAIRRDGLPETLRPLVCGFAGYGNVSKGAQEIFDLLPVKEVAPGALPVANGGSGREVCKTVFREEDMVAPRTEGAPFDLQDYYDRPEGYRPRFERFLPHLTLLVNAVYWDERYPRLVTREAVRRLWSGDGAPALKVIGDISADVEGAVEVTLKCTDSGNPVFVYDAAANAAVDGVEGAGPVILAVDNLPAELPREASTDFSAVLADFVPPLASAGPELDEARLPDPLKRALIVKAGRLTPGFAYLEKHL